MKKVVLLRHGESTWNRENRFTGWTDVDLSEKGVAEAEKAGLLLREEGFLFGHAYTSYLKRAVKTLGVVLDKLEQDWVPGSKSWRLNEKHYGSLQGLNKKETAEIRKRSFCLAAKAEWSKFIVYYEEAFRIALEHASKRNN